LPALFDLDPCTLQRWKGFVLTETNSR
jgi:hypothetical protein